MSSSLYLIFSLFLPSSLPYSLSPVLFLSLSSLIFLFQIMGKKNGNKLSVKTLFKNKITFNGGENNLLPHVKEKRNSFIIIVTLK